MSGQRKRKKIKAGDRAFDIINTLLLVLIFVIILYPMYYVLIASFSNPDKVLTGKIFLLPKGFQLESYKTVFSNSEVMNGYLHTILYATVGTLINLFVTLTAGYALSREDLRGRKPITLFFHFYHVFQWWNRSDLYAGEKFRTSEYVLGHGSSKCHERMESDPLPELL